MESQTRLLETFAPFSVPYLTLTVPKVLLHPAFLDTPLCIITRLQS